MILLYVSQSVLDSRCFMTYNLIAISFSLKVILSSLLKNKVRRFHSILTFYNPLILLVTTINNSNNIPMTLKRTPANLNTNNLNDLSIHIGLHANWVSFHCLFMGTNYRRLL